MSATSGAIKNSILAALIILLVHSLAKKYARPEPSLNNDQRLQKAQRVSFQFPDDDAEDTDRDTAEAPSAAKPHNKSESDVLDYVFGPANVTVPTLKTAVATPASKNKESDKNASDAHAGHMVIGRYDNESTMCGGKIFDGIGQLLQGFDGNESAFQSV